MNERLEPLTVILDMDDTVYDLVTPWYAWYNEKYDDDFQPCQQKTWAIEDFVKPECGLDIFTFLTLPHIFRDLKLYPGAYDAIKTAHELGARQVFLSKCTVETGAWDKQQAVERDLPFLGKERVIVTGGDKGFLSADVFFDDGPHNLVDFASHQTGATVLATMGGGGYAEGAVSDYTMWDWKQYLDILREVRDNRYGGCKFKDLPV